MVAYNKKGEPTNIMKIYKTSIAKSTNPVKRSEMRFDQTRQLDTKTRRNKLETQGKPQGMNQDRIVKEKPLNALKSLKELDGVLGIE